MVVEIQKRNRSSNKSLLVFLSMVVILVSILLFTVFLIFNFRMYLAEQTKESAYLENTNLLSEISLYLKKIELSLLESKLTSANLMENGNNKELLENYIEGKTKQDSDIRKIYVSSNRDSSINPYRDSTASSWFLNAKKANGKIAFTLPYHDSSSNRTLIDFSTSIYNSEGQDIGVVSHSIYLDKLTRELQKQQKSSEHQIYLLDYSQNPIISIGREFDKAYFDEYAERIFSYSNLFAENNDFYIFFTPIFDRNFVLISKIPAYSFYTTKNFFFNKTFIIPVSIFVAIITFVSIFVILLMGIEQRKKEKIEVESLTDPLTGIFNRRYFENTIEPEFTRMKAQQKPISLLMLDIDFFKQCNDAYGHSQGDEVLKTVTKCFARHARRKEDFAARLGGEEFGILLVGTDKAAAVQMAENIRKDVEKTKIQIIGTNNYISITISIGVASFIPQEIQSFQMLYDMADRMLYKAKESGRNKVCS